MKRLAALFLVLLMGLGAFACGGKTSGGESSSAAENSESEESSASSEESSEALPTYDYDNEALVDSLVRVEHENEIKVLFFSDTQIIDKDQARPSRQGTVEQYSIARLEELAFNYMRKGVAAVQPDLILLNGDNVYGEFDDNGSVWQALIAEMESYEIPWAPVFGNHDNESAKGAAWQCEQLEQAEHCLFKRGSVEGNGNYSVGIERRGRLERVIYCMDSNGCGAASDPAGNGVLTSAQFTQGQLAWLDATAKKIEEAYGEKVASSLLHHIPTLEFALADAQYADMNKMYHLNLSLPALEGDFGSKGEGFGYITATYEGESLETLLKKHGVDSVFVGHEHNINTSIMRNGIRYTYCVKTTKYDYHIPNQLGCTVMGVSHGKAANVSSYYFDEVYAAEENNRVYEAIDFSQTSVSVPLSWRSGETQPEEIYTTNTGVYDLSKAESEDSFYFGKYSFMGDVFADNGFRYLTFEIRLKGEPADFDLFLLIGSRHTHVYKEYTKITSLQTGWQSDHHRISSEYLRIYNASGNLLQQYVTTESFGDKSTAHRSNLARGVWYTVVVELAGRASYAGQGEYGLNACDIQLRNIRFEKENSAIS